MRMLYLPDGVPDNDKTPPGNAWSMKITHNPYVLAKYPSNQIYKLYFRNTTSKNCSEQYDFNYALSNMSHILVYLLIKLKKVMRFTGDILLILKDNGVDLTDIHYNYKNK